jgi:hypothetical protein
MSNCRVSWKTRSCICPAHSVFCWLSSNWNWSNSQHVLRRWISPTLSKPDTGEGRFEAVHSMRTRASGYPSWPGVNDSTQGRIHWRRPTVIAFFACNSAADHTSPVTAALIRHIPASMKCLPIRHRATALDTMHRQLFRRISLLLNSFRLGDSTIVAPIYW